MGHFPFQIRQLPAALQDFASEMENIVENVFNSGCNTNSCNIGSCESSTETVTYRPAIDVLESDSGYDLHIDLPGVMPDHVKVELLEDRLHVTGIRTSTNPPEGSVQHRSERLFGKFMRVIQLPKQIDAEHIEANFNQGVLHVRLPKQPKPVPKQIEIRVNV